MTNSIHEFTSKYRAARLLMSVTLGLLALGLAYQFEYHPPTDTKPEYGFKAVSTLLRIFEQLLGLFRNAISAPVAWAKQDPELARWCTGYGVMMTALSALSKYEWLDWSILGMNALIFMAALAAG